GAPAAVAPPAAPDASAVFKLCFLPRAGYAPPGFGLGLGFGPALMLRRWRNRPIPDRIADPPPVHQRLYSVFLYSMLEILDLVENRIDQHVRQQARLEPQVDELGVLGVVVVDFGLDARVRDMLDLDAAALVLRRSLDQVGELRDRELLGELVEDAVFAGLGGFLDCDFDASHRVANVQVAAGLAAFAVHGERMPDRSLDTEPIEHRSPDSVVVETGREALVEYRLVGVDSVNDALVEVGRPDCPDFARELDIVRVVNLGQVIERARLLRVRQRVGAPVVRNLNKALFDVDVGGSVLAHRAELDQVALRHMLANRVNGVERTDQIIDLGEHRMAPIDHRKWRAALLAVVDDCVGFEIANHGADKRVVGQIADRRLYRLAALFAPRRHPVLQRSNRNQAVGPAFQIPQAPIEVVHHAYFVAALGQVHRLRPSEVAVPTRYNHPH